MLQTPKLVSRSELEFFVVISRSCKVHDLILIWALSKLNSGGEHILGCYHGILLSTVTLLFLFQLLVFNVFHWNAEASFCISGFGLEFLNALLAQTFYGGAFSMQPRCIWCMTLRWKLHGTCVGTSPICFVVHYMCSSSFLFESLWWRFNQLGSWLRLHSVNFDGVWCQNSIPLIWWRSVFRQLLQMKYYFLQSLGLLSMKSWWSVATFECL